MGHLGAVLEKVEPGRVEISLPFRPELSQQHGFFHAGVISTIADTTTPALDAEYWVANVRQPVRFSQAITTAAEHHTTFIEISPHPTLTHAITETLPSTSSPTDRATWWPAAARSRCRGRAGFSSVRLLIWSRRRIAR